MASICLALILSLLALCEFTSADLYCKDEKGRNVDWFIVYKLPKINQRKGSYFSDGFKYAYISGPLIGKKNSVKGWKLSEKKVTDVGSMFGQTLSPVYKNPDMFTTLQYNDDPPAAEGNTYWAHAKGALAMDAISGFWLTHSIPRFSPAFNTRKYEYPDTASNNGQTALCISFKTSEQGNNILNHLLTLRPNIYYSSQRSNVLKDDSVFVKLTDKKAPENPFAQFTIKSVNGMVFNTFSKNSKISGDLYDQYMAPAMKAALFAETWRRGSGGPLPSSCSNKNIVENVDALEMSFQESQLSTSDEWIYTQDHSKWAVTTSEKIPFTCIGDINRMKSQFKRGGGAVCMSDRQVWKNFRSLIKSSEECKGGKSKRPPVNEYPYPKLLF